MPRVALVERQASLVGAARRLMASRGLEATTTRAIAAEADVPLGVVHYCFHSKEELLGAVARSVLDDQLQAALDALRPGADLAAAVGETLDALWQDTRAKRERHLVLAQLLGSAPAAPSLAALNAERYRRYHEAASLALETLATAADTTWRVPLASLARLVVAAIDGTVLAWLADGDDDAASSAFRLLGALLVEQAAGGTG